VCRRGAFRAQATGRFSLNAALALALFNSSSTLTLLHGDSVLDGEADGACALVKLNGKIHFIVAVLKRVTYGILQNDPGHCLIKVNRAKSNGFVNH
jgi:hypothetical protein